MEVFYVLWSMDQDVDFVAFATFLMRRQKIRQCLEVRIHTFSSISLPPRTARCEPHERTSRNVGQSEKRVINRWRSRTSFLDRKLLSTANSALSRVTLNYANSQSGKYNRSPDDELLRAVCCRRDDHSYFISPYFFFPRDSHFVSQVDNKYNEPVSPSFKVCNQDVIDRAK